MVSGRSMVGGRYVRSMNKEFGYHLRYTLLILDCRKGNFVGSDIRLGWQQVSPIRLQHLFSSKMNDKLS